MYTIEEQKQMICDMKYASTAFYADAVETGNHAFIEFTGLMNEYIKLCEQTMAEGIDFNECNVHVGQQLKAKPYNLTYIREKLDCIFGKELDICKS